VMVSADERSNEFRTRVESLGEFVEAKEIPKVRLLLALPGCSARWRSQDAGQLPICRVVGWVGVGRAGQLPICRVIGCVEVTRC